MRRVVVMLACLVAGCLATGCLLDESAELVGYIPVADACDYCDCATGDVLDDLLGEILED